MAKLSFKPERVAVFSSNENPAYYMFADPVRQAWTNMGFNSLFIDISPNRSIVPSSIVPTASQSQIIRVLAPALFPDKLFVLSDIDMLPLNSDYFHAACDLIDDDLKLINMTSNAYNHESKFPICYYVGMGSAFAAVTGVKSQDDIERIMKEWWSEGHGWITDEVCFGREAFKAAAEGRISLDLRVRPRADDRIDRSNWSYDSDRLMNHNYIDSHMLRPFADYVEQLRPVFMSVGVEI